jgi:hypothetical protein
MPARGLGAALRPSTKEARNAFDQADKGLQALSGSGVGYHTVEVASVGHEGAFAITHSFYTPGVRRLRVKVPGDPENQGAATATVPLEVAPALASALTPETPGNSRLPSEGRI